MWIGVISVIAVAIGGVLACGSLVGLVTKCGSEER
jgi:hypothetical protein